MDTAGVIRARTLRSGSKRARDALKAELAERAVNNRVNAFRKMSGATPQMRGYTYTVRTGDTSFKGQLMELKETG